jgi:hypothetical protein
MGLEEIGSDSVDWTLLAQDKDPVTGSYELQ